MRRNHEHGRKALASLLLPFLPAIFMMALVCLFKGSEATASAIWQSWDDAFRNHPDGLNDYQYAISNIGYGVGALTWSTMRAARWHLSLNLFHGTPIRMLSTQEYAVFPLLIWMFVATFYMVTHLNTVKVATYKLTYKPQIARITKVLILQFIFMLPMFTVLSCDYGRTIPYWVFSSLFALHIFGDLDWRPLNKVSTKVARMMDKPFLNSAICFLIVALLIPFDQAWGPLLNEILPLRLLGF